MNKESSNWETLASAIVHPTEPVAGRPPFGFASRVVSQWRETQRNEVLGRWSRWSLRAAIGSVAVCVMIVFFGSPSDDSPGLLLPPSAGFVAPPLAIP